tara:strand:- start:1119 stop:1550 length:432 start_codon:yes stop_codon:yes gene_type:complete
MSILNLPRPDSGDASEHFGLPPGSISWATIERICIKKGTTLAQLKMEMGLLLDDKTPAEIKVAMRRHRAKHGRWPNQRSGDASECFDCVPGTITWMTMFVRLKDGTNGLPRGGSLYGLVLEMETDVAESRSFISDLFLVPETA